MRSEPPGSPKGRARGTRATSFGIAGACGAGFGLRLTSEISLSVYSHRHSFPRLR